MNPEVDDYIAGSDQWPDEMAALRRILLDTGLDESITWRSPCYRSPDGNIAIMQEMKGFLSLMFFKGHLLEDPTGILVEQGTNTRSAKRVEFTSTADVETHADALRALVADAVRIEAAGLTVEPAPEPDLAAELRARLHADPELRAAFEGLTRGRRREYNLYISGAKQPATRDARVEKIIPKIRAGKGLRDR